MDLQIGKALIEEIGKWNIGNFIEELTKRLEMMDEKWVIDRFEGNVAICENRETKEQREIVKENLPKGVAEGTVLSYKNGEYTIDVEEQQKIEDRIQKKMDDLWN
ncbi:MAG: DUF3006 domain-containing protein [Clostridia bacterium]